MKGARAYRETTLSCRASACSVGRAAIVSNNSFRIATLPRKTTSSVYSFLACILSVHFVDFDIDELVSCSDAIFLNFPRNLALIDRWGQYNPRGILERYFGVVFSRRLLHFARLRSSPAIARWGVVQLVGHLTVNEDGEGSNPSAPANFPL